LRLADAGDEDVLEGRPDGPHADDPLALLAQRARQIELGRLRPHDPRASARAFMGMLLVSVLGRELFPVVGEGFPARESYGREVTSIFLHGLSAGGGG
jgi:hypothetical protein